MFDFIVLSSEWDAVIADIYQKQWFAIPEFWKFYLLIIII